MSQTMSNIRRNSGSLNEQFNAIPFPTLLEQNREAVMNALPKHMSVDRIMRIALTAFRRNDALQKCNPLSVLSAVVQASQLGLEIGQNGAFWLRMLSVALSLGSMQLLSFKAASEPT